VRAGSEGMDFGSGHGAQLLEGTCCCLRGLSSGFGVAMVVSCSEGLPVRVRVSADRLD
jgi:hypothetical protein